MKCAFIGIGKVGFALADNLQRKGHQVVIAHDEAKSSSVQKALAANPDLSVLPMQKAVDQAEMVFLATPFAANEALLEGIEWKNQVLIDCTNPVGPGISHGLESKISGAEKVQEWAKGARVVKAFTIYGFENLENAHFPSDTLPVMLMAGEDDAAKRAVGQLIEDMGYQPLDTGSLKQSLHLEHMTLLWVTMVRANGHHPHFTWGYLERSSSQKS